MSNHLRTAVILRTAIILLPALLLCVVVLATALTGSSHAALQEPEPGGRGEVDKKGMKVDLRSEDRDKDDTHASSDAGTSSSQSYAGQSRSLESLVRDKSEDLQLNDPGLDTVQLLPGFRPIVRSLQQVPSVAAHGRSIVTVYNTTTNTPASVDASRALVNDHFYTSAYSTSTDDGRTWTGGFIPPIPGYLLTANVPYVVVDRRGNFYYQGIAAQSTDPAPLHGAAFPQLTVQVNSSRDGIHWGEGVAVDQDEGDDHTALAVGPDPNREDRDNVYVTWLSFNGVRSGAPVRLRFARSTDGGATWTKKTIAQDTPNADPIMPQSVGDSTLSVDPVTGRLYVAFLNFSGSDQDFIRVLVSDDAGETFKPMAFNLPGAAIPDGVPFVQPGHLCDCGRPGGGTRLIIHSGQSIGGGRFGLPRYINASRIGTQPSFAAAGGHLYLTWSQSTSPSFGDDSAQSNVMLLYSDDDGAMWSAPQQVNPATPTDIEHVMPTLVADRDELHLAYYTEHSDGTLDVEIVNLGEERCSLPVGHTTQVNSRSFTLPPANIPAPTPRLPFATLNYDFFSAPCMGLGTRFGMTMSRGRVYAVWADSRNLMTEPTHPLDPLSGRTHPQVDIFFREARSE